MSLAGDHAVVTGGGSGIGAAVAAALVADGARVSLIGRRCDALEAVAGNLGGQALACPADVTEPGQVAAAFKAARAAHGPVTILVNNAGAAASAPLADVTLAGWRALFAVNLEALFTCTQAALPDLRAAERGRIVAVASTAGLTGYAYCAPYCAAKHGVVGFVRALALELARTAVTVNAVCPGFTDTAIAAEAAQGIAAATGRSAADARASLERFNPQGRLITPAEVADAVLWLCQPGSGAVTGQALAVAGGEVM